jgi:DNA-binding LacI/PurR family transcriptional regulator
VLTEYGIAHDDRLVAIGDYSRAGGESRMRHLLDRAPDLDAVFVASDLMATGALTAINQTRRRLPEDIAVGGYDDSPLALDTQPPLTTIRQPWDRKGHRRVHFWLGCKLQVVAVMGVPLVVPWLVAVRQSPVGVWRRVPSVP